MTKLEQLKQLAAIDISLLREECNFEVLLAKKEVARMALELMDWQPIETAPKDGTDILVFSSELSEQFVCKYDRKWVYAQSVAFEEKIFFIVENPTYWMPLPKPPTSNNN